MKQSPIPRKFIDLHTHSTASDGALSPAEVVAAANAAGLLALALTDHDTIAGLAEAHEAARQCPDLKLINGIEVSARFAGGMLHILGLGLEINSSSLTELMEQLQQARTQRNPKILKKLVCLGINLSMDDVLETAEKYRKGQTGRIISRLHIAQAMLAKGAVKSVYEAFAKYIGTDKPAYVDKEQLSPAQAIRAIHAAGAVAVLAHPPQLNYQNRAQLERILRDLIHAGLDGIEAFHGDNTPDEARLYLDLAKRYHLGVTGGSDFHGMVKPNANLGQPRITVAALGERFSKHLLGL